MRWKKEAARELGIDLAALPPRDRLRYWYLAIAQAQVDSPKAVRAGDELAKRLVKMGYKTSASPHPA